MKKIASVYITGNSDDTIFGNLSYITEDGTKEFVDISQEKLEQIRILLLSDI